MSSLVLDVWWLTVAVLLHYEETCNAETRVLFKIGRYSSYETSTEAENSNSSLGIILNNSVILNCSFDVASEKQILWWFKGRILFSGNESFFKAIDNVRNELLTRSSHLHIEGFYSNNTGEYICKRGRNETGLHVFLYLTKDIQDSPDFEAKWLLMGIISLAFISAFILYLTCKYVRLACRSRMYSLASISMNDYTDKDDNRRSPTNCIDTVNYEEVGPLPSGVSTLENYSSNINNEK
ncbi:hypothetical protein HOLleu_21453 [Holothuria leucospilota]|uniref:Ig-like domain-containing protein n=1 Tax=Holothuria leucospilota TaxID=206669 RepID=A0A9Q1BXQ6_HOLLE|nr:hypothetical protein HOLleu_21453 [Holothuria leucospilota]